MEDNQNGMQGQDMQQNRQPDGQQMTYGQQSQMYVQPQKPANHQQSYPDGTQGLGGNVPYMGQQPYTQQQQGYGQQNYGQPRQPGYGYNNGFRKQEPEHGPVTDVFCYLILVILPLNFILGMFQASGIFGSLNYTSILDNSYMNYYFSSYNTVYMIGSLLLSIAYIVFLVLDIVKINQQHYNITGLVLFAVFLTPGYFLWRSHILGRKKTFPIIYTVALVLLMITFLIFMFYQLFLMVSNMIYYLY